MSGSLLLNGIDHAQGELLASIRGSSLLRCRWLALHPTKCCRGNNRGKLSSWRHCNWTWFLSLLLSKIAFEGTLSIKAMTFVAGETGVRACAHLCRANYRRECGACGSYHQYLWYCTDSEGENELSRGLQCQQHSMAVWDSSG